MSATSKRASRSFGGFFDLPALKAQLAELEARMAANGFWDDAQAAQKVIGEANAIRAKLDPLKELEQKIADLKTLKELVIEDASDAAAKEFQAEFDAVAKSLDALELRVLARRPDGPQQRHHHAPLGRGRHRGVRLGQHAPAHVPAFRGKIGLQDRDARHPARRRGGDQLGHAAGQRRVRLWPAQGRARRPPARAHLAVQLGGQAADLVRVARRDRRGRRQHRHQGRGKGHSRGRLSLGRSGRAGGQHDRLGGAASRTFRAASSSPARTSGRRSRTAPRR